MSCCIFISRCLCFDLACEINIHQIFTFQSGITCFFRFFLCYARSIFYFFSTHNKLDFDPNVICVWVCICMCVCSFRRLCFSIFFIAFHVVCADLVVCLTVHPAVYKISCPAKSSKLVYIIACKFFTLVG